MKWMLVVAGILFLSVFIWRFFMPRSILYIHDTAVSYTIADTAEKKTIGLSGRRSLGQNQALVFPFGYDGTHGIWMRDMHFSIDIIWLDADKKVVTIASNVSPDTFPQVFTPDQPARYVIEVNANKALEWGLEVGDTVEF